MMIDDKKADSLLKIARLRAFKAVFGSPSRQGQIEYIDYDTWEPVL